MAQNPQPCSTAVVPTPIIKEIKKRATLVEYFSTRYFMLSNPEAGLYLDHHVSNVEAKCYKFIGSNTKPYRVEDECQKVLDTLGITWSAADFAEPEQSPGIDTSANPSHYADFAVSPVDLIGAYELNFFEGNVVKYVARARRKNGREDLLKALWYLLWCLGLSKSEIEETVKKVESR